MKLGTRKLDWNCGCEPFSPRGPHRCIYCTTMQPGQLARHISHVHNQSHNKFYFTPVVLGSAQRLQGG